MVSASTGFAERRWKKEQKLSDQSGQPQSMSLLSTYGLPSMRIVVNGYSVRIAKGLKDSQTQLRVYESTVIQVSQKSPSEGIDSLTHHSVGALLLKRNWLSCGQSGSEFVRFGEFGRRRFKTVA